MQTRRTAYQDQMVLTSHQFKIPAAVGKKRDNKSENVEYGNTRLMLIVNNWGFVQDTQHEPKVRQCVLSDFQVQLKLTSSAFRNPQNPDTEFPFDKQAANFPYDSFVQVMRSKLTRDFIADVRSMYEETEGKFVNNEPDDDEDTVAAAGVPAKKPRKIINRINDEDENDGGIDTAEESTEETGPSTQIVEIVHQRKRTAKKWAPIYQMSTMVVF